MEILDNKFYTKIEMFVKNKNFGEIKQSLGKNKI